MPSTEALSVGKRIYNHTLKTHTYILLKGADTGEGKGKTIHWAPIWQSSRLRFP
jgi:hypothetical protein